jgi:SP family general alpha glucoside:H+ symporter-like MFS transporter
MSGKHTNDEHQIEMANDLDTKEEISHFEGGKEDHGEHSTLIAEALAQVEEESKMSLWKIFKLYYPGATYGLLLSVALVMEGYDTGLVSSLSSHRCSNLYG